MKLATLVIAAVLAGWVVRDELQIRKLKHQVEFALKNSGACHIGDALLCVENK